MQYGTASCQLLRARKGDSRSFSYSLGRKTPPFPAHQRLSYLQRLMLRRGLDVAQWC